MRTPVRRASARRLTTIEVVTLTVWFYAAYYALVYISTPEPSAFGPSHLVGYLYFILSIVVIYIGLFIKHTTSLTSP